MSTPEAKQFAEEWAEHEGWPDSSDKAAMAVRFDAATAKLREQVKALIYQNSDLRDELDASRMFAKKQDEIIAAAAEENAKLREELLLADATAQALRHQLFSAQQALVKIIDVVKREAEVFEEFADGQIIGLAEAGLAHQQPSAPAPERKEGEEICTKNENLTTTAHAVGDEDKPPTPDVEQLARKCCQDIEQRTDDLDMRMHAIIVRYLTQARAPLVEMVRFKPTGSDTPECARCGDAVSVNFPNEWEDGDLCYRCADAIFRELRKALTGTGEKA